MKLSENFTLEELCFTEHDIDNIPNKIQIQNLTTLTVNVLQPLRNVVGSIKVNSGFRSETLNKEVGGSKTSAHKLGCAADITRGSKELNKEMFEWIRDNCKFRQLINESDYSWIHVEYRLGDNKKQILQM